MRQPFKHAIGFAFVLGLPLYGQQAPSGSVFDVATIKEAPPITQAMVAAGRYHVGMKVDTSQVDIGYSSLADLIRIAFQVKPHQISGPAWMPDQKWDILAKMPGGAPASQVPQMLQVLLAERFGLKVHRESRESKVYGLEVAKGGSKLQSSPPEEDKPLVIATTGDGKSTVTSGGGYGLTRTEMQPDGSMHLESSKMTLAMLADALSYYLDRPVLDLTQLTGSYRVELEYSAADLRYAAIKSGWPGLNPQAASAADASRAADLVAEPAGVSLTTSVRKLGLQLRPQQSSIEMIVVDQLERAPTGN